MKRLLYDTSCLVSPSAHLYVQNQSTPPIRPFLPCCNDGIPIGKLVVMMRMMMTVVVMMMIMRMMMTVVVGPHD